ncbi:MAG: NUDIX domain-containing protein, partial [Kordiimonas sp.]
KGLLGGMPGLFSTEWKERGEFPNKEEWLIAKPSDDYFKTIEGEAKHTFTHFHLLTRLVVAKAETKHNIENGFWHPISKIEDIGLPTVFAKIADIALK